MFGCSVQVFWRGKNYVRNWFSAEMKGGPCECIYMFIKSINIQFGLVNFTGPIKTLHKLKKPLQAATYFMPSSLQIFSPTQSESR